MSAKQCANAAAARIVAQTRNRFGAAILGGKPSGLVVAVVDIKDILKGRLRQSVR